MKPNFSDHDTLPLSVEAHSTTPQPITTPEQDPFANAAIKHPLPSPDMPMANRVPIDTLADTLGIATSQ